ncbi:MAG: YvcK family protein [Candidatus Vogelbacteria bacterium]|nr:YvcK family protein [Candidatus Vogelbacteria bacterium]
MRKKVVTIGGGTGQFTVLTGLKKYPELDITAIVSMADDGGSTGVLRDEYGVLPPGDLRQCLVALSRSSDAMRNLMNYRFDSGQLKGHNFGNLLITVFEKISRDYNEAINVISEILNIQGRVVPVTLDNVHLMCKLKDGRVIDGEHIIETAPVAKPGVSMMSLTESAKANPLALKAIREADMIIVCPGNLYASLIPNLLVHGIPEALRKSDAKKVFVCNLMNRKNQTDGYSVSDYVDELESYVTPEFFTHVIANTEIPPIELIRKYKHESTPILAGRSKVPKFYKIVRGDFVSQKPVAIKKGDPIKRTLIRHDSNKLARQIVKLL